MRMVLVPGDMLLTTSHDIPTNPGYLLTAHLVAVEEISQFDHKGDPGGSRPMIITRWMMRKRSSMITDHVINT